MCFFKHKIVFVGVLTVSLFSCVRNDGDAISNEQKFDEDVATLDIINQTLPVLLPDSIVMIAIPMYTETSEELRRKDEIREQEHRRLIDSLGMDVFFDSTLFVPDSFEVNWMLKKGADPIIKRFLSDSLEKKKIELDSINDYGRVKVNANYPNSSSEMDRHRGFIGYSRMLFHSKNTKALFLYRTSMIRYCCSSQTNVVEVEKVDDEWKIIFHSNKSPLAVVINKRRFYSSLNLV